MKGRILRLAFAALLFATPLLGQQRDLPPLTAPGATIGALVRDSATRQNVVVTDVPRDTPAEKAGLRKDDVVIDFDGIPVENVRRFKRIVAETPPDRTVKMTIERQGKRLQLTVTPVPTRAE
jgi:S1-C subfamily serine protease